MEPLVLFSSINIYGFGVQFMFDQMFYFNCNRNNDTVLNMQYTLAKLVSSNAIQKLAIIIGRQHFVHSVTLLHL